MAWLSATVQALPGDLDLGFGNGGIVVTPITDGANLYDEPNSMLVQPDGKIVVCGQVNYSDDETGYPVSFFLARYNLTGTLDTSFGTNGKVIAPIGDSRGGVYVGESIALQPDGKIVTVGHSFFPGGSSFAVYRYNPDGTLDTSFGAGGVVITSGVNGANDVALQPDGKIIVIGSANVNGEDNNFAVVRYNPNGSLDNSFGTGGKVVTPVANGNVVDQAYAVALQPDGKIVVVGTSLFRGLSGYDLALVRYNANGSLDSGFGANGKIIHSITNEHEIASDVALQPDGKIVVVGDNRLGVASAAIVRYNSNGSVDTSFAANGIFTTERNIFSGRSIALQPDGKIVAFGSGRNSASSNWGFAVARLNANGSPDASFGPNGTLITPIGTNESAGAFAGTVQPDGKILAFGGTRAPDGDHIALTRHLGDSASPNEIDDSTFFVRQHYLDFLNREPEAGGLAYWTNEIARCGGDPACINRRRIDVSAAFFIEQEFQETGYFVYRFYKVSFGRQPNHVEFNSDRSRISAGTNLEPSKQAFAAEWVQRPAFVAAFPVTMSNTEFVNKLFEFAGLTAAIYDPLRQQEILAMNAGRSRALVVRDVIEIADFKNIPEPGDPRYSELKHVSQYNPAFVLMQYFGYLRRDVDPAGYAFWLDVVNNREPNNYRGMVCAFLTSNEYQTRFGSVVTRSNADCGP